MKTMANHVRLITQDSLLLTSLTRLLTDAGFQVSASPDPEESLAFIAHAHPAVVLCDCATPEGTLPGSHRRISEVSPETQIVLLFSGSDRSGEAKVLRLNRHTIVCPRRPLRPRTVLHAIERALDEVEV